MPRLLAALAFAALAAPALAQPATEGGSVAPGERRGESRDESRPADAALKGGAAPERAVARCKQLTGELREQCRRDLGDPSAGGTQPPRPSPVQRDPVTEPPPQNPGQPR
jgi:hypothetical protein